MFESLPNSVAVLLVIMKPEPSSRAFVEPHGQRQVVKSRLHPETTVSFLMKRNDAVLWQARFGFRIVFAKSLPFSALGFDNNDASVAKQEIAFLYEPCKAAAAQRTGEKEGVLKTTD